MEKRGSVLALDGHEVKYTLRKVEAQKGTIILCHGINMDRDEWRGFYRRISDKLAEEGFSSIRFDFRGHGDSEVGDLGFTVTGGIMDLESVIEEVEGRVSILASSMGALPAIFCASETSVGSLALVCPLIDCRRNYFEPKEKSFVDKNRSELRQEGFIRRKDGFRMAAELIYELRSLRPHCVLEKLECPVVTFQGKEDTAVSPEVAEKYGAPNHKSQLHLFEDAGHGLVHTEEEGLGKETRKNWEEFQDILTGFLKQINE